MKKVTTFIGFLGLLSLSAAFTANAGIDCKTLPKWSSAVPQVNLHHVFCGEMSKSGSAVGYHANPNAQTPSTYVRHRDGNQPNAAGIYNWYDITLLLSGKKLNKPVSTFFPNHCSKEQVISSIQYAYKNGNMACSGVSWAKCGYSAPSGDASGGYCIGLNKKPFVVATAAVNNDPTKINTGFPIRQ